MSNFGRLIRAKRGDMTQGDVAGKIGITQPQLGRWERGESHPSVKHLEKIVLGFKALGVDFTADEEAELRSSLIGQRSKSPMGLLSRQRYLEEQAEYLETMQRAYGVDPRTIRICFLGAGNLPVIDSEQVQDVWIQNLHRSISYCVFWCVDAMDLAAIDRLSGALKRISVKLMQPCEERHCGLIKHYPIFQDTSGKPLPQKLEGLRRYRSLKDSGLARNHFYDPDEQLQGYADLLAYFQCFGNTVTYLSTDRAPTPITALLLDRARLHIDSRPRPVYLFLDDEKSRSIADSLRTIMTGFESTEPRSRP